MSNFIGPRPGWDQHIAGTIRFEIDLELWSNSGRDKHVDLTEQGGWVANYVAEQLRKFGAGDDMAIHRLRYYGAVDRISDGVISEQEIGIQPED